MFLIVLLFLNGYLALTIKKIAVSKMGMVAG
jgi:hypothetical protein